MKKPRAMLLLIQEFVLAWKQQITTYTREAKSLNILADMNLLYFAKSSVCFTALGVSPLLYSNKRSFSIAVSGKLGSEGQAKKRRLPMPPHEATKIRLFTPVWAGCTVQREERKGASDINSPSIWNFLKQWEPDSQCQWNRNKSVASLLQPLQSTNQTACVFKPGFPKFWSQSPLPQLPRFHPHAAQSSCTLRAILASAFRTSNAMWCRENQNGLWNQERFRSQTSKLSTVHL